jgi:hypothetical protein
MCDEFIVECGGVFLELHDIDRYGGHFGDNDSAEGVRDMKFYLRKLELQLIPTTPIQDANCRHRSRQQRAFGIS